MGEEEIEDPDLRRTSYGNVEKLLHCFRSQKVFFFRFLFFKLGILVDRTGASWMIGRADVLLPFLSFFCVSSSLYLFESQLFGFGAPWKMARNIEHSILMSFSVLHKRCPSCWNTFDGIVFDYRV